MTALIARSLTSKDDRAILVDADRQGGALDVLLGIEHETGARWQNLGLEESLPDPRSLSVRIPSWDGVSVLSLGSWSRDCPDVRDMSQVVSVLAGASRVLVDSGRSCEMLESVSVDPLCCLVVCELSVHGLARAKGLMRDIRTRPACLVGVSPHMARAGRVGIDIADAADYLDCGDDVVVAGPLPSSRSLSENILTGLGLSDVNRRVRGVVESVAGFIRKCEEGVCGDADKIRAS
ncbi:hypothetical protein [uncultured Bifidobacterium sp.]|uniref:hypothetical protein n=1 Tax=uncultured Bifidobacterium sp. TaxID=165187 RepID=UPI002625F1D9|nr:hypothetical protein [uncultured Bifidobacterium sp.]